MLKRIKLLLIMGLSVPAGADFTTDSPLNFGEIAVTSNDSVSTLSVSRSGAVLSTNHIYVIHPGTPGVYTLSNLPPYITASLSVDLPADSAMNYPNTAQFTMSSIDMPSSVIINAAGSAQFKMGGTLSTSGNPAQNYYSGANYVIYLNLNITY